MVGRAVDGGDASEALLRPLPRHVVRRGGGWRARGVSLRVPLADLPPFGDTSRGCPRDHGDVGVPVYRGSFDTPQAERLLWRAGFGPRAGEAEALAKLGLQGAVHALLYPGREKFVGPAPHDSKGR